MKLCLNHNPSSASPLWWGSVCLCKSSSEDSLSSVDVSDSSSLSVSSVSLAASESENSDSTIWITLAALRLGGLCLALAGCSGSEFLRKRAGLLAALLLRLKLKPVGRAAAGSAIAFNLSKASWPFCGSTASLF